MGYFSSLNGEGLATSRPLCLAVDLSSRPTASLLTSPPFRLGFTTLAVLLSQSVASLLVAYSSRCMPPWLEEKLHRPPTALELCLYFHTKDHVGATFLNQRVDRIVLTQLHGPDMPIDETELYLSVMERDDKGQTYGLGWTPSQSRRRHAGVGSSRPMSANDEPIEQLRGDIKEMQRSLLRVINDKIFDRDLL
ncbi:hypothetical protein Scep_010152 [Stephania cephalantha]|uniref:Uncharacterized protein n=1 Tax=Stephania cephalantha TaxID=152367 RepID=A0AAP0PGY5_9MAGN